jgi:hypothetical protein
MKETLAILLNFQTNTSLGLTFLTDFLLLVDCAALAQLNGQKTPRPCRILLSIDSCLDS